MRRYHFWLLALGLMAMTPAVTEAGWFSKKSDEQAQSENATKSNQQVAEQIGKVLRSQNLKGHDIAVEYKQGVAVLRGYAPSERHRANVTRLVASVADVKRVDNRLRVSAPPKLADSKATAPQAAGKKDAKPISRRSLIQQASAEEMPHYGRVTRVPTSVPQSAIRQVAGEVPAPAPMPGAAPVPGMAPAPGMAPMGGPIPNYGSMATPASHAVYDMPNLPEHAWPAYAAYPNYAAVTYPKEYSAAAWPYIGPFYPYPQVPLGWRKAQLEWDDGYWKLNFKPRTEKWWWFLSPKNW